MAATLNGDLNRATAQKGGKVKALIELNIDGDVSTNELKQLGRRIIDALSAAGTGPRVTPRLLVETNPNYLEISLERPGKTPSQD